MGAACGMCLSLGVTFCLCEHGLPLESLSSTRTCVGWLTVADFRPAGMCRRQTVRERVCGGGGDREGGREGREIIASVQLALSDAATHRISNSTNTCA